MRRMVCLPLLLALTASSGPGWAASSPGGGQTESSKSSNTAGIIAMGAAGLAIVGGVLWWHFHQAPGLGKWDDVIIRKPFGPAPVLITAEFQDGNPPAEKTYLAKEIRDLVTDALKYSQAYRLQDVSTGATGDSGLVLSAKISVMSSFSQAEFTVSRKGELIFNQTFSWFEKREIRKQVAQLVNQITEKVK